MALGVCWRDGCCGLHAKLYDAGAVVRLCSKHFPVLRSREVILKSVGPLVCVPLMCLLVLGIIRTSICWLWVTDAYLSDECVSPVKMAETPLVRYLGLKVFQSKVGSILQIAVTCALLWELLGRPHPLLACSHVALRWFMGRYSKTCRKVLKAFCFMERLGHVWAGNSSLTWALKLMKHVKEES